MSGHHPFFVKPTFYVREDATLVLVSTGRRVGTPGSTVWRGAWTLPLTAADLGDLEPELLIPAVMQAFLMPDQRRPLSGKGASAYMRSWTVKG